MGVTVMMKTSFISIERGIGEQWKSKLQEAMAEAGLEEKRLAEERGVFHEGVPAINVILDCGGWIMRSQRHSYNAESSMAIIISSLARRQESYCTLVYATTTAVHVLRICPKSASRIGKNPHLEVFLEAEEAHGVRYTHSIVDGDSYVHTTILQSVPGWGFPNKKLECANTSKCY